MRRAVLLVSALVLISAAPAPAQLDQLLKELDTLTRPGVATPATRRSAPRSSKRCRSGPRTP